MSKYDLEERLVNYTCGMIDVVNNLLPGRAGNYIKGQSIRSCHSPAFNYGEAQAAESRADFIHKLKVCLKELKECRIALQVITKKQLMPNTLLLLSMSRETNELIAIIGKSISTAEGNDDEDNKDNKK